MMYNEWLEQSGYEEGMIHDNSVVVVRKDGEDIWNDGQGHGFKALSCEKLWQAGYNASTAEVKEVIEGLLRLAGDDIDEPADVVIVNRAHLLLRKLQ